jgi:hypothetical protein
MHCWLSIFQLGNESGANITQPGSLGLGQLHLFAFCAQQGSNGFQIGNLEPSLAVMLICLCHYYFPERDKIKE